MEICKSDLTKIIKYLNDAAALYDQQHKQKYNCRAWCIRQLTTKLTNKLSQQ